MADQAKAARHFAILGDVEKECLLWARQLGVQVHCLRAVATFEDWDDSAHIWVFFTTDEELQKQRQSGFTTALQAKYRQLLSDAGYDFVSFPNLSFGFDSDQNVQENFEGNYFHRLR